MGFSFKKYLKIVTGITYLKWAFGNLKKVLKAFGNMIGGFAEPPSDDNTGSGSEFQYPTATEDRAVPEIFGTIKVSPNILKYKDLNHHAIEKKGVTIGYWESIDILLGIGGAVDVLKKIYMNKEQIWPKDTSETGWIDKHYAGQGKRADPPTPDPANVGNGWMDDIGSQWWDMPSETWTFTYLGADEWSVVGSASGAQPNATTDTDYTQTYSGSKTWVTKINTGTIAFAVGDIFTAEIEADSSNDDNRAVFGKKAHGEGRSDGSGKFPFYFSTGRSLYNRTVLSRLVGDNDSYFVNYPGISLLILPDVFIGDGTGSVPNYAVQVKRSKLIRPWRNYRDFDDGHANPAYIIAYIYWKMLKVPLSNLHEASFLAAAATLHAENMGMSFAMQQPRKASEWIDDILRHITAVRYIDPADGLIHLKLIRDDYDAGALQVITEDDIKDIELVRKGWDQCVTHLTVKWINNRTYEGTSKQVVNPAAFAALGYMRHQSLEFPLFTSAAAVAKALTYAQRNIFYPFAVLRFTTSRTIFNPMLGSCFKFTSATLGVTDMVFRVMGRDDDDNPSQEISIEAIEDQFGLGNATVYDLTETPPDYPSYLLPGVVQHALVVDAPPDITTNTGLVVLATKPATGVATGFTVEVNGSSRRLMPFSARGTLNAELAVTNYVESGEQILVDDVVGLTDDITNTDADWQQGKTMLILGTGNTWEAISIKTVENVAGAQWQLTGLIRGFYGTPIQQHAALAEAWIVPDRVTGMVEVDAPDLIPLGSPLSVVIESFNPYTSGLATTVNHTYTFRPETPLPVSQLTGTRTGDRVTLTWVPAVRRGGMASNAVNIDKITAADLMWEGVFEIVNSIGITAMLNEPRIDFDQSEVRTYTVKNVVNGYKSAGVEITI